MTTTNSDASASASFAVEADEKGCVVLASGEIDLDTVRQFQDAVDSALATAPTHLTFDLGGTTFMDSSGLAVLVAATRRVSVSIRNPSTIARRIVEISGLAETLGLPE